MMTTDAGDSHGRRCTNPKCGAEVKAHAERCGKCGRVLPLNQLARQSGLYARYHPPGLRQSAEDLMAGIVADRGGEAELSTLEASYIRKIGDVEILIRLLTADVSRRGLITSSGSFRNVGDKLLVAMGTFDKLAMRIGLGRRAASVLDLSPAAYMEMRARERAREREAANVDQQPGAENSVSAGVSEVVDVPASD